jgi:hypothetical protein
MVMRVFVSSTSQDLVEHRAAAVRGLRRLGHDVVAMEDFTAAAAYPLDRMMDLVRSCDALVVIVAWRYGFVPEGQRARKVPGLPDDAEPGKTSITEFEYLTARQIGLPILAFILAENAPWIPQNVDGFGGVGSSIEIVRFRTALMREHVVSTFAGPDGLEALVSAAITTARISTQVLENRVALSAPVVSQQTVPDSHFAGGLLQVVSQSWLTERVVTIDIGTPWWSTRLHLLATLLERLTAVQRVLVLEGTKFVGLVSIRTITTSLPLLHPELKRFDRKLGQRHGSESDVQMEAQALVDLFQHAFAPNGADMATAESAESAVKMDVTRANLMRWFGDAMITSPIEVHDVARASVLDMIRVLDFPADFVPVLSGKDGDAPTLAVPVHVIDKPALSQRLARSYVRDLLDTFGLE